VADEQKLPKMVVCCCFAYKFRTQQKLEGNIHREGKDPNRVLSLSLWTRNATCLNNQHGDFGYQDNSEVRPKAVKVPISLPEVYPKFSILPNICICLYVVHEFFQLCLLYLIFCFVGLKILVKCNFCTHPLTDTPFHALQCNDNGIIPIFVDWVFVFDFYRLMLSGDKNLRFMFWNCDVGLEAELK